MESIAEILMEAREKLFPTFPRPTEAYARLDGLFGLCLGLGEDLWGVADLGDEVVEITQEIDEDVENRHPDQEPHESEEILRDEEDEECEEDGEFHVGWDDSRIEIVGLDGVDEDEHGGNREEHIPSTVIVSDDENRNNWEKCPENRNEPENEDDNSECDDVWECFSTMKEADNNQRCDGKKSIDKSDKCLCLENEPESFGDFAEDDAVFLINKRKIPFLYRFKIGGDFGSIDEEDVTEDHGDQEFSEENPDIFDILECPTDNIFDGSRIKKPAECFIDPEIDIDRIFEIGDGILYLISDCRRIVDESFSFLKEVRNECIKEGYNNHNETYVDNSNDDGERRKCPEEFLGESVFEMRGELAEFLVNRFAHIEEEVREEEGDEENHQERLEEIDEECEKENGKKLLEKIPIKNEFEDKRETHREKLKN